MDYNNMDFFPAVNLIISNKCRMNCSFCCSSDLNKKEKIELEKLLIILKTLKDNGTKRISFTGGEPLLCPNFSKVIDYSYKLGLINTVMSSDGDLVKKLNIDGYYFDTFWLSVHGLYDQHDNITNVKGSFQKIQDAITEKNKDYNFGIWSVITADRINQIDDFIKWCINNNASKIYLSNLNESGNGKEFIEQNGMVKIEDFAKLVEFYQSKYGNQITISGQKFDRECQCTLVHPNGEVYLTPYKQSPDNQILLGNVIEDKPKEVFYRVKNNKNMWNNYTRRYISSSLFK